MRADANCLYFEESVHAPLKVSTPAILLLAVFSTQELPGRASDEGARMRASAWRANENNGNPNMKQILVISLSTNAHMGKPDGCHIHPIKDTCGAPGHKGYDVAPRKTAAYSPATATWILARQAYNKTTILCGTGAAMIELMFEIAPGSSYKFNTAVVGEQVWIFTLS